MRQLGVLLTACTFVACNRTHTTTPGGIIPTPHARAIYVTNNGSDSISAIDTQSSIVTTVPIDIDPTAHEAPHHLAVDASHGVMFVALAFPPPPEKTQDPHASHGAADRPGKLALLDLATLAVKRVVDVDENPGDVILTHDHAHVLVTHFDMRRAMDGVMRALPPARVFASLHVYDARTLGLFAARPLCAAPHGMDTSRDDHTAFVACYGSDELTEVDLTNPSLSVGRYPVGPYPGPTASPRYGPYSATLSPDGRTVVVCDLEGSDVRVFDVTHHAFIADHTIALGARAFIPAFIDAHTVVVPMQAPDGMARIDLTTGTIQQRVGTSATCKAPHVARLSKAGRLYVVCEGDHVSPGSVVEMDPQHFDIKRTWVVGVYPDGMAFGDD